jgi:hypothetical protein
MDGTVLICILVSILGGVAHVYIQMWERRKFAERKEYRDALSAEVDRLLVDRQYPRLPVVEKNPDPLEEQPGAEKKKKKKKHSWPNWPPMGDCPLDRNQG